MKHAPSEQFPGRKVAAPLLTAALSTGVVCLLCATPAPAALSASQPLEVRILLDNSGSMYPGYSPGSGQRRSELGVKFFHQFPKFREWLGDFVARQTILNGKTVGMAIFTSSGSFRPGHDVREIHGAVPLGRFDVDRALDKVPGFGLNTYLAESLDEYTRDFEGLVWLITDNIVETGQGNPDEGVEAFFRSLRDTPRYRSVHLFKLPFQDPDTGLRSVLAIYGILVSKQEVPDASEFDRTFRHQFRTATRPGGSPPRSLFPGQEHLKLKNLNVDALELQIPKTLEVEIGERRRSFFRERQTVRLKLPGIIRSNLTQHSVIGGSYTLAIVSSFQPDEDGRSSGIETIPADSFTVVTENLERSIPPTGNLRIEAEISSKGPLSLSPSGFLAWIKAAVLGLRVEFVGKAQMSFKDIRVRLERERMAGIFGVDKASRVFDFQDIQSIVVQPDREKVSFVLESGGGRGFLLLIILLVLGTPLGYAAWSLQQKASYRVTIGTNPPTVVALRRLGRYRLQSPPHSLGSLIRGIDGRHRFQPNPDLPEVRPASATRPGSFNISLPGGEKSLSLTIEPLDSKHKEVSVQASGRSVRRPSAAPPPPPGGPPGAPAGAPGVPKRPDPSKRKPAIRRPGR